MRKSIKSAKLLLTLLLVSCTIDMLQAQEETDYPALPNQQSTSNLQQNSNTKNVDTTECGLKFQDNTEILSTTGESPNKLAFELFKRIQKNETMVFSPVSIYQSLVMFALGAQNDTLNELLNVLQVQKKDELTSLFIQLDQISKENKEVLNSANGIFYATEIQECYSNFIIKNSESNLKKIDTTNPAKEVQSINEWVSQVTQGEIKNLLPPDSVNRDTTLLLVNALRFESKWKEVMEKSTLAFQLMDGTKKDVEMLTCISNENKVIDIYESNGSIYARIPYSNEEFVFEIYMPSDYKNLLDFDPENLQILRNQNFEQDELVIKFPSFEIENGKSISLKDALQELKLKQVFEAADLSMLTGSVKLTDIYHQANVKVNEAGTKASAVTAANFGYRSSFDEPLLIIINKPFLYFISHKQSGIVLFMGQYTGPVTKTSIQTLRKCEPGI